MSTYNICFYREIRKILCEYPLLSVAMHIYLITHNMLLWRNKTNVSLECTFIQSIIKSI